VIHTIRTVFYYPQNRIPKEALFAIPLGTMGSRNGPFFRARPLGLSLRMLKSGGDYPQISRPVLLQLEKGGVRAIRREFVLAWFKAVAPGKARIPIETKRYFRDNDCRVDKIIELQIGH
jgi:hypothetical protein